MDSKKKKRVGVMGCKKFVKQLCRQSRLQVPDILEDLSPSVILCQYCISTK